MATRRRWPPQPALSPRRGQGESFELPAPWPGGHRHAPVCGHTPLCAPPRKRDAFSESGTCSAVAPRDLAFSSTHAAR